MEKHFLSDSGAKEKDVIARIKSYGKTFEILVAADKAMEFKKSGKGSIVNILIYPGIYSDAKKGIKVKEDELEEVFGTSDVYKVAEKIIKEGEIQMPSSYKEKEREMKLRQIVDWLSSSCSDPAGRPHPPDRIRSAIEQSGAKIDDKKSAEEQSLMILKLIQKILPIKLATKRVAIKVPAIYTGSLYGYLKDFIIQEEWLSDGSLSCVAEIPAKMQLEFFDRINSATHGAIISKEM